MKKTALNFSSVDEICAFLRETNRRHFYLLGKKSILIAPFTVTEIQLAETNFGAKMTHLPDIGIPETNQHRPCFHRI